MSDQPVYVTQHYQTGKSILHLREDCPAFRRDSTVVEKPREVFPDDQPVCKRCRGAWEPSPGDRSAFESLLAAAKEAADGE